MDVLEQLRARRQSLTLHLAIGQFTGGREGRFQEPFVPRLR